MDLIEVASSTESFTTIFDIYYSLMHASYYFSFRLDFTTHEYYSSPMRVLGYEVVQSFEALRYKPECRSFDSRCGHCLNPSGRSMAVRTTQSLTTVSTRLSPGGKGGWCVGLTTLPPLKILRASTSWSPKGLSRPV
jgi:hypothetical protein